MENPQQNAPQEQPRNNLESFEGVAGKYAKSIDSAVFSLDSRIQDEPSQEKKTALLNAKQKCARIARRFLRTVSGLASLAALAGTIQYEATRYEVTEKSNEKGEVVYNHSDPETTHVINVLAGVEEYSQEERLHTSRLDMADRLRAYGEKIPENIETYTIEQLDSLGVLVGAGPHSVSSERHITDSQIHAQRRLAQGKGGRKLYELLWRLESECGNPKIRFTNSGQSPEEEEFNRPHYNSVTNTYYILSPDGDVGGSIRRSIQGLFAEGSHAKQFDQNPVSYRLKELKAFVEHPAMLVGDLSGHDKFDYTNPGTLEYEAHSEIQPKLEETYSFIHKVFDDKEKK